MALTINIYSMSASGHVNPMSVVVERLVREYKCRCIWYSLEEFKETIENIGAEFRLIHIDPKVYYDFHMPNKRSSTFGVEMDIFFSYIEHNSLNIAKDLSREMPDLILLDAMAMHVKFAFRYFEKFLAIKTKLAPIIYFETSFAKEPNIFPNAQEFALMNNFSFFERIRALISIFLSSLKMRYLSWRYGIEYIPPIDEISYTDPNCIKLVSTFPQFQPRHHLFSKNVKFIGSCIDDKLRVLNTNDAVLQRILSKYPPKNPIEHKLRILSDKALIYIALGTVFNQNLGLYKKIISAIELLKGEKLSLKFENIDFLISAGIVFEELRKTEKSSNIHIMKSAPQLEILKRASLFVTHCGMNSMNETIYFGVPTVCIPLASDQPMVAHQAVELGIGIYVDFVDMKPIVLKNAIRDVLENNCYREKAFEWSTETRMYTGKINGADEVMAFLKNKKM